MQSNLNFKNLEIAKGYIPFRANKWKLWDKMGQKKILAHSVTLLLSENKSNKIFITLCKGPFLYRSMFFFFFLVALYLPSQFIEGYEVQLISDICHFL